MSSNQRHCATCICGHRAPVQASRRLARGPGTVAWSEHIEAWAAYASIYGTAQTAERIAERGGFNYAELLQFLERAPETWEPR